MQRLTIFCASLVFSIFAFGFNVHADDAAKSSTDLQFNNLGNVQSGKAIQFKVPTTEPEKKDSIQANPVENIANDEPFKTYLGYPKHEITFSLMPLGVSEKWNYNNTPFNFSSNSTGFDLLYRLLITPQMNLEVDLNQYTVKTASGQVFPYNIESSTANVRNFSAAYNYFWIASNNFFHRWGVGADLGYSSYPVLSFATSTDLQMTSSKDTTIGIHGNYQIPIVPSLLFLVKAGYLFGTGLGNSGYLTTKSDGILWANLGVNWTFTEHSSIDVILVYSSQKVKTEGPVGGGVSTDTWKTTSNLIGGKVGYKYSF